MQGHSRNTWGGEKRGKGTKQPDIIRTKHQTSVPCVSSPCFSLCFFVCCYCFVPLDLPLFCPSVCLPVNIFLTPLSVILSFHLCHSSGICVVRFYNAAYLLFMELRGKKKMSTCTHGHHTVVFLISLRFMSCCESFIYLLFIPSLIFCCCCAFVSFLVVSGKLKCHPSPTHRPDRDGEPSQPRPTPSSSHHFSTIQSALLSLLSRATVTMGHKRVKKKSKKKKHAHLGLLR